MPKISRGGVSNRLVDPDFIAEPGTPVEVAIDEGRPDVGLPEEKPATEPEPEPSPEPAQAKPRPRKSTLPK